MNRKSKARHRVIFALPALPITRCVRSDGILFARSHAHVNERKTASLAVRLNGHDVLVPLGPNLQLYRVSAAIIPTRHRLGHVILAVVVSVAPSPTTMALDGLAIFGQLFVVVSDDFVGSVIAGELRSHHFQ